MFFGDETPGVFGAGGIVDDSVGERERVEGRGAMGVVEAVSVAREDLGDVGANLFSVMPGAGETEYDIHGLGAEKTAELQ